MYCVVVFGLIVHFLYIETYKTIIIYPPFVFGKLLLFGTNFVFIGRVGERCGASQGKAPPSVAMRLRAWRKTSQEKAARCSRIICSFNLLQLMGIQHSASIR